MKTAMQELIDWIKEHRDNDKILMQQHVIAKGYELLEKEREQLLNAFRDNSWDKSFNQYYNETYNQNK
jgi:hypothetical protein